MIAINVLRGGTVMKVLVSYKVVWSLGIILLNSLIIFFFRRNRRLGWLDRIALGLSVIYCIAILALAESLEIKLVATALTLSAIVIRLLAAIKNRPTDDREQPGAGSA